jgi:hypothetical protein
VCARAALRSVRCAARRVGDADNAPGLDALAEYVQPLAASAADLTGYWELEEAEDDMTAHTLVHMLSNGDLSFGKTDGPIPSAVQGTWRLVDADELAVELRVTRAFDDVRFPYKVMRTYAGSLTNDGPLVIVNGPIQIGESADERGDDGDALQVKEAGYFQLTKVPDFPIDE